MPSKFLTHPVTVRNRGRLPHFEQPDAVYFITFRLADSLPRHVAASLREERLALLRHARTAADRIEIQRAFFLRVDEELDQCRGECHLRDPRVAQLVVDALRHFDGDRYRLISYSVMPNHVHVIAQALGAQSLARIVHSWKSYTSNEANALLGRAGAFWQEESFDHIVRDEEELARTIEYVRANPAKAGLKGWRFVF
ncbi:MAG TPA: transposase [Thermoanaerobaculia bacterium]|nr:transposase [Thermoanaerobaculia bacterium]